MMLSRRTFMLGSAAATLGTACGGSDTSDADSTPADTNLGSGGVELLAVAFPDGFRAAATVVAAIPQRISFLVSDQIDYLREAAPQTLDVRITRGTEEIATETLALHRDGIITPYYPMRLTFPEPGEYQATLTQYGGVESVPFLVADSAEVTIPQVGHELPVVDTPTVDDNRGVTPICTRAVPCPFHDHNLGAVATNGRPTVVLVATPGFCQTEICGPVVDLLIDAASARDIDIIHAEVYQDPSVFETGRFPDTTVAVQAFGLPFEPALFVADGDGMIVERLDTTWDRAEATQALDLVS